jgi:hypothetical protein
MRGWPRACIVESVVPGYRVAAVIVGALACGCAESRFMVDPVALDGIPEEEQRAETPAPPIDSFWLQEAVAESTRPPPRPVHSISLGYVGDTPLTGGVMRDTPMPMQQGPNPTYVDWSQPGATGHCSCAAREPLPIEQ